MSILFTVVIPSCHRNDLLAACLEKLEPGVQSFPEDRYEVIVSDDGITTTAEELINNRFPWAKWINGPKRGPAANRNNGARQAAGDWIVFLDDDCIPDCSWLSAFNDWIANDSAKVIEGKTAPPCEVDDPFVEHVENLTGSFFYTCNLAVQREIFFELGQFDEDFLEATMEDLEFACRVKAQGIRTAFCPGALVMHPLRHMTLRQVTSRILTRAKWSLLLQHKTGRGIPLTHSCLMVVVLMLERLCIAELRAGWHLIKFRYQMRTRLFHYFWGLFIFPVKVIYLISWELRFRSMLLGRKAKLAKLTEV